MGDSTNLSSARVKEDVGLRALTGNHADLQAELAGIAASQKIVAASNHLAAPRVSALRHEVQRSLAAPYHEAAGVGTESSKVATVSHTLALEALSAAPKNGIKEERSGFWAGLWSKAKSFVSDAADVARGIGKGVVAIGKLLYVDAPKMLFSKEFWSGVGSALTWVGEKLTDPATWKAAAELSLKAITLGPRVLIHVVTHPIDSLQKVGSFLKGMSDGLGITDICVGVGRIFKGDFAGALQAFKGAGTAFVEFTGLADAYGAVKHLGQALYCLGTGDRVGAAVHFGQAVMHGAMAAMSIGSIAATVATGGAAAGALVGVMMLRTSMKTAAKQVLKTASKEFFKKAGEELGENLVKSVGKDLTKEILEATAVKSVDAGSMKVIGTILGKDAGKLFDAATSGPIREQLLEKLAKEMNPAHFEKAFREVGLDATSRLMKDAGVAAKAEKLVFELLQDAHKMSKKELAQKLEKQGWDPKRAREAAADVKKALRDQHGSFFSKDTPFNQSAWQKDIDAWKSAAAKKTKEIDAEIVRNLTEGMKKPLTEMIVERQKDVFMKEMRSVLLGQGDSPLSKVMGETVERQAKAQGKSVASLADEYAEASWKGYREGIGEAVEAAVKEGIERGVKRFRETQLKLKLPSFSGIWEGTKEIYGRYARASVKTEHAEGVDRKGAEQERFNGHRAVMSRIRNDGGRVLKDNYVQKLGEDKWELDSTTEVAVDERNERKPKGGDPASKVS
jgi:hypothetical protein